MNSLFRSHDEMDIPKLAVAPRYALNAAPDL